MTMTTQIKHTIRCDTSWCSSPALASTPETELRATALGVPAAKLHAADAVAVGWRPNHPGSIRADYVDDELRSVLWTCPSCRAVADPAAVAAANDTKDVRHRELRALVSLIQRNKDRLTAVLALPQSSDWPLIVAAVEHLVLPDRVSARQKAEARQVWRCAVLYYHVHLQTSDIEDFETWWRLRP